MLQMVAAVTAVVVGVCAPFASAQIPPGSSFPTFPPVYTAVVLEPTTFNISVIEVPLQFRSTAATFVAAVACVPPLGLDPRGGGGPLVGLGTDPRVAALGECATTTFLGMAEVLVGPSFSEFGYAAASKKGVNIRRVGDSRCAGVVSAALTGKWPLDSSTDAHPGCIGLAAVAVELERLADDGFNADGREGLPRGAAPRPFLDVVTGYEPVNQPGRVKRLLRWEPLVEDLAGFGTYVTQRVTAAQAALAKPLVLAASSLRRRRSPPPYSSPDAYDPDFVCGGRGAVAPADDPDHLCDAAAGVAAAVREANDTQQALVAWFDQKGQSLAFLPLRVAAATEMSFTEYLIAELAVNVAVYNSMLVVWQEKLRADAVRPATLVPRILGGGLGAAFAPSIRTMPHSEYPSASACVCTAFTDALRYFGGDAPEVSHVFEFPPNRFRPGVPRRPLTIRFSSLAAISSTCGDSRVWGGLHFLPAVAEGHRLCKGIADEVVEELACRFGRASRVHRLCKRRNPA